MAKASYRLWFKGFDHQWRRGWFDGMAATFNAEYAFKYCRDFTDNPTEFKLEGFALVRSDGIVIACSRLTAEDTNALYTLIGREVA